MLKRTAKVVFAAANWVFPGGRVDPDDHAADFDRVTHGLTDAEARLVHLLLEGRGLTAAAEQLGLSRNTVHSQLASVFQKTGTRRQGELLSLLLGGVAPVEAPDPISGFHGPGIEPPTLEH